VAVQQNHPNGLNYFCFWHDDGSTIGDNLQIVSEDYRLVANHDHFEGKLNQNRYLRLFGRQKPPDYSSETVSHSPLVNCFSDNPMISSEIRSHTK
jgi:hypothetical protein